MPTKYVPVQSGEKLVYAALRLPESLHREITATHKQCLKKNPNARYLASDHYRRLLSLGLTAIKAELVDDKLKETY